MSIYNAVWTEHQRNAWINAQPKLGDEWTLYPTTEPDPAWVERFFANHNGLEGLPAPLGPLVDDQFRVLVRAAKSKIDGLLKYGGWAVCHPALDDDLDRVISRGILLDGRDAIIKRGKPSSCHQNSWTHWVLHHTSSAIMTGYALSQDGMWREHSWIVTSIKGKAPHIIETTVSRLAYCGYVLTPAESEKFITPFMLDVSVDPHEQRLSYVKDMRARLQNVLS